MKRIVVSLALFSFAAVLPRPCLAQTIPNPSFEADTFTVSPGYVSANGAISSWSGGPDVSYGLNPAAGSPFADNGTIPDGTNAAFLQRNDLGTFLETSISDLVNGETYQLTFRVNARTGNTPKLDVAIDSTTLLSTDVRSVGGANPYAWVGIDFTATGTVADLRLTNTAVAGDHTVVLDDFRIAPTTSPWSIAPWNDDATSGVDPQYTYTHAYNFGTTAASTVINEVLFAGVTSLDPAVTGSFSTTGLTASVPSDANNVTGGSRALANTFCYNGFPATLTLEGLTPSTDYVLTIYSVGWEAPGARFGTFRSEDDVHTVDQDTYDNDNGIRFDYAYTSDGTGTAVIETMPVQNASIHWYGFCNRETTPIVAGPATITFDPQGATALVGDTVTLSAAATGTRPIDYKWYKDGVEIVGETDSTLSVAVTGAAEVGFYRTEVTNAFGSDASEEAFLQVYEQVTGLLYGSGVDAFGTPLAAGADDPHYTLTVNPNGAAPIPAVVQSGMPAPPWLANSGTSQWIGPVETTGGAAGGDYTYQASFDLTGLPKGLIINGSWTSDNAGIALQVNGLSVPGAAISTGEFGGFVNFIADTTLLPAGTMVDGINTLEFVLNNAGAGFTGLRVDNLSVFSIPSGIAPIVYVQPVGQDVTTGDMVTLSAQAYGSADLTYQWRFNGADIPGATTNTYTIASTTGADAGDYDVVVTNSVSSTTSAIATLTATDVPPSIVTQPTSVVSGEGLTAEFTVVAEGSPTLTYQWKKGPDDIPGAVNPTLTLSGLIFDDAGSYSVVVTNPFGMVESDPVTLAVLSVVPGFYNTGVDAFGVPLADNASDSHYTITVNPNGASPIPAVVEDSTRFPIGGGPWLANSSTSKWIGPAFFTDTAAAGDYHYAISFDLTGFDLGSVSVSGSWTSDNAGVGLFLNGGATGITQDGTFSTLFPFTISSGFQEGANTLEFVVNNASAGYTGLRVEGLHGFGTLLPNIDLPTLTIALNGFGNPVISFVGNPSYTYRIERSTALASGGWSDLGPLTVPGDNNVTFEDTVPPVGQAHYRVVVSTP